MNHFLFVGVTIFFAWILSSCDDKLIEPNDTIVHPINPGEIIINKDSASFTSEGGEFVLGDGSRLFVPAGPAADGLEVNIRNILNPKYYSSFNSNTYDLAVNRQYDNLKMEFLIPSGLNIVDIKVISFDPLAAMPDNSMNPDCWFMDFIYDKATGRLVVFTDFDDNEKNKYRRFIVSWNKSILVETGSQLLYDLPYYSHQNFSAWTAASMILAKAYNNPEIDLNYLKFISDHSNASLKSPLYLESFYTKLPEILKKSTGKTPITETYINMSALQNRIISLLKEQKPVLLNMRCPESGIQNVLVLGYKVNNPSDIEFIYHNSSNRKDENMYKWKSFNDYIINMEPGEAAQILYFNTPVSQELDLQTITLPSDAESTYVRFKVFDYKGQHSYSINADYDPASPGGISWYRDNNKINIIPDSAISLELILPVWNADRHNADNFKISTEIISESDNKIVHNEEHGLALLPVSQHMFNTNISTGKFHDGKKEAAYKLKIKLLKADGSKIDGFNLYFKMAKR
jgi:hypothetical protein